MRRLCVLYLKALKKNALVQKDTSVLTQRLSVGQDQLCGYKENGQFNCLPAICPHADVDIVSGLGFGRQHH